MSEERPQRLRLLANLGIQEKFAIAYGILLLLFGVTCFLFAASVGEVRRSAMSTGRSQQVVQYLDDMQLAMTGQQGALRGYLLTQKPEFLEPFRDGELAFDGGFEATRELAADDPVMQTGLSRLRGDMRHWRDDYARPQLRLLEEPGGFDKARAWESTGFGRSIIESMRGEFAALRDHELARLQVREAALQISLRQTLITIVIMLLSGFLFGLLVVTGISRNVSQPLAQLTRLMSRLARGETALDIPFQHRGDEVGVIARGLEVFRQSTGELAARGWVKTRLAALSSSLQPANTYEEFAEALLPQICQSLGAVQGALFLWNERSARFEPAGGYARDGSSPAAARAFRLGEGPVGQAAKARSMLILRSVPADYLAVRSGLGGSPPRLLMLQPLVGRENVLGVLELALFEEPEQAQRDFLTEAGAYAGLSLETLARGLATMVLLRQTQKHQEELQASEEALRAQQEEMRATNESLREKSELLERQGQRLRASEEELRSQADELRATNSALEEKAEQLRAQKHALEQAQAALEEKTVDLEQASRYKSEFLANMSHELRTPLNSMLILSKSLADNDERNLTPEQIESARIVYDSGRSLLKLINDILDLSKVEAGKMQVVVEELRLDAFMALVERNFRPVAQERKLRFTLSLAPDLPASIHTDAGKLNQIVTNLLSNAFKFTREGGVTLEVGRPPAAVTASMPGLRGADSIMFRVSDTGIGIAPEKMLRLFQAFEQGDSGTSRRYGGTGLGLSISQGLTQLLHGEIRASSVPDKAGTVFTVVLPERIDSSVPVPALAAAALEASPGAGVVTADDMAPEGDEVASILIIEDDAQFAEVLAGIARAKQYRALVAHDGENGLRLARRHRPSGILLDIGLPGIDGWQVMEALKRDPATLGIPVHFISGIDESGRALAMGAASFLKKPVSKPQVAGLLDTLPKPKGGVRWRILVIDDHEPDRRLVREMLRREPVDITEAATAREALERMERESFDLLILDLGLPGMDGFEFLEVASRRPDMPAVVIHSGRELTREEALKLREHTDTIVMKNAPSPQRLLDEVTLFLHSIRRVGTPEPATSPAGIPELSGRTVLVVDDDMRNIFALSKTLRLRGLKVVMAQDGRKALAQLENNPDISLVLMDIMMPGMDGYETMRQIRARPEWRKLPIIAVSAKAMVGDSEKCIEAGANDYCSKPIDVDQLLEQIKRLLA